MSCEIPKNGMIGKSVPVRDAVMKVVGQIRHTVDMKLPGMPYAKILSPPVPYARIRSIDTTQAQALEGVHAAVCRKDSPKNHYNGSGEDKDVNPSEPAFDQTVRFVGDKVAAVVADTEEIARKALSLIPVEYEEFLSYLDPEEAMKEDAYPIHQGGNVIMELNNSGGGVNGAIRDADYVFRHKYEMLVVNHCSLETHASITEYDTGGRLTVWTPTQDTFGQRANLQCIFELPMSKIRVISPAMGGGLGGKIDPATEPVTALLTIKTGRPVKTVYSGIEEFCCTHTRHAAKVDLTMAVKKDGAITAANETMILDANAHTSATMSMCWAAGDRFHRPLKIRNMRCRGAPVYINTPAASAMRGLGSPQQFFPVSSMMNEIAQSLYLDPPDVFLKNLADSLEAAYNDGEPFDNFRPKDYVIHGREFIDWYRAKKQVEASRRERGRYLMGVGMACGSHGASMLLFMPDTTGTIIKMNKDGTIVFTTGTSDIGSGSVIIWYMLTSEVPGIPLGHIAYIKMGTDAVISDLGAYVSRGTYTSGHAVVKTARIMRDKIVVLATELLDIITDNLDFHDDAVWYVDIHRKFVSMKEIAVHAREEHQEDLSCSYMSHSEVGPTSGGAHFAKVQVDTVTGGIKVLEYVAIHDVGRVVSPTGITGQLESDISMGLGHALCEETKPDNTGRNQTSSFKKYHILNVREMPKLSMDFLDSEEETGLYGAKSIGECAVVPVAPAIANTVSNAVGGQFYKFPIRPEDVLEASSSAKQERPDRP